MANRTITDPRTGEVINDPHIRPFGELLRELGSGATDVELAEGIWDVIQRVRDTGKKGSLTLTIAVAPIDKKDPQNGPLSFVDSVKVNLPEYDRTPVFLFTDREGNPTRSNPLQAELTGLRDVSVKAGLRQPAAAEATADGLRNPDHA